MFEYTKTVLELLLNDIKRARTTANIVINLLYVAYLSYAIIANTGNRYVNAALLALSVCYFIYSIVNNKNRKDVNTAKRLYKSIKLLLNGFTLGITVYSVCLATTVPDFISLLLAVGMVIGWVLSVVLELLNYYIVIRKDQIMEALNADFEPIKKVIEAPNRLVNRIMGKGTPVEEASNTRKYLNKIVDEKKAQKAKKKQEKRALKEEAKERAKEEKKQAKKARKEKK